MAKNNFRGMPGGMNQAAMMKQAQKMQQEMLRMQEEMENKTWSATAGGGMVTASVNGKHEVLDLKINPEAVDPDDVEMLQDMIIAAVNEAMRTADAEAAQNMSRLTGGMNLGGLFEDYSVIANQCAHWCGNPVIDRRENPCNIFLPHYRIWPINLPACRALAAKLPSVWPFMC